MREAHLFYILTGQGGLQYMITEQISSYVMELDKTITHHILLEQGSGAIALKCVVEEYRNHNIKLIHHDLGEKPEITTKEEAYVFANKAFMGYLIHGFKDVPCSAWGQVEVRIYNEEGDNISPGRYTDKDRGDYMPIAYALHILLCHGTSLIHRMTLHVPEDIVVHPFPKEVPVEIFSKGV